MRLDSFDGASDDLATHKHKCKLDDETIKCLADSIVGIIVGSKSLTLSLLLLPLPLLLVIMLN